MPKDRYRLYHLEKARGGVGLTMIGGSAVVSPDSPPAFGNMLLYKDEIVPWLRRLADDVPRGRRRGDVPGHPPGSPDLATSPATGCRWSTPRRSARPQHRSFPKVAEPWDVDRIVRDFADAAAALRRRPASTASRSSPTATSSTPGSPRPPTSATTSSAADLENRA